MICLIRRSQIVSNDNSLFGDYQAKSGNDNILKVVKNRGDLGELQTFNTLGKHFGYDYLFTNLYLPTLKGTRECDIVLVTSKAVYIIENKNWNGIILGNDKDKNWRQVLDGKTREYYNPVKQNYSHVCAFRETFKYYPPDKIFSIVVFRDLCELMVDTRYIVCHRKEVISAINFQETKLSVSFRKSYLDIFRVEILVHCKQSDDIKRKHIERIKSQNL